MNNFKMIYKILKYLEAMMDVSEPDMTPIRAEALGMTNERWSALMEMLLKDGYVDGASAKRYIRNHIVINNFDEAKITLKGLEYLQENSLMKKAAAVAGGVVSVIN